VNRANNSNEELLATLRKERQEMTIVLREELQNFAKTVKLPRLLTPEDLAEWLGVKVETVHTYVSRDRLPHLKIGPKVLRFERDHVVQWARSRGKNMPDDRPAS
jgi:excisionase family DNA binding protein